MTMSRIAPFMTRLLSMASLRARQSADYPAFITVRSEPSAVCRSFPDMLGDFPFTFRGNTPLNLTCWTLSSMLDDEKGRYDGSSWIWAWVELDPDLYTDPFGRMGVGNKDQGGVAGGYGCWMHENDISGGGDLYLPGEIQWCGDAPHHQVRLAIRAAVRVGSVRADENPPGGIAPRI